MTRSYTKIHENESTTPLEKEVRDSSIFLNSYFATNSFVFDVDKTAEHWHQHIIYFDDEHTACFARPLIDKDFGELVSTPTDFFPYFIHKSCFESKLSADCFDTLYNRYMLYKFVPRNEFDLKQFYEREG